MRRKTSTFAALVLSAALTSTATPAAELSQAVDTTQEIPKVKPKAKHFP